MLIAAAICGTGPSLAAETPFQLDYAADDRCPDRNAFADSVAQRVRDAGVEAAYAMPVPVKVSFVAEGSKFVGTLELVRRDDSHYQRTMHGDSCAEVANALAFVLALTLTAAEPPPTAPEAPTVIGPQVAPERVPEPPAEKRRSPWDYGVGVQVGARAGLAPQWALVEGAFLEVRRASPGPFSFNLRAAFLIAPNAQHTGASGTVDFSWWAARLEGCPVRLRPLEWLAWLPCAGTHVGRSLATGYPASEVGVSEHPSQLWLDGFAASRLELAVARWLSVQAHLELLLPLTRYQFAFDSPDTPIYQVPLVAGAAFAGVEVRFP